MFTSTSNTIEELKGDLTSPRVFIFPQVSAGSPMKNPAKLPAGAYGLTPGVVTPFPKLPGATFETHFITIDITPREAEDLKAAICDGVVCLGANNQRPKVDVSLFAEIEEEKARFVKCLQDGRFSEEGPLGAKRGGSEERRGLFNYCFFALNDRNRN